jgi:hypothetical protein
MGLAALPEETAEALAKHQGSLSIKVAVLSGAAARHLSHHRGTLLIRGLTTLSPEAAEELAQHKGSLSIGSPESLSPACAKALSKHDGLLMLNSVTTLSDGAVIWLSRHRGGLALGGLETLSDKAAAALAKGAGSVQLEGIRVLSEEADRRLRANANVSMPKADEIIRQEEQANGGFVLREIRWGDSPDKDFVFVREIDNGDLVYCRPTDNLRFGRHKASKKEYVFRDERGKGNPFQSLSLRTVNINFEKQFGLSSDMEKWLGPSKAGDLSDGGGCVTWRNDGCRVTFFGVGDGPALVWMTKP